MKPIQQQFSVPFGYPVWFTEHLFSKENPLMADFFRQQPKQTKPKLLVVADSGVVAEHAYLTKQLSAYFDHFPDLVELVAPPLVIEGGEACKNDFTLVHKLLEAVDTYKIDRHSYMAALGGGALLDLVGFVAAIAHRGIRHLRIPTTVLSQNDSGVGVKNGINLFGKKNFLGTFAPPVAVFNDTHFLTTLHDRDWRSGIAEAVKVALIKDQGFFESLQQDALRLANRDMPAMQKLIYRCAHLHLEHIGTGDPFEMGSSRPLDFGHWAAHKLEHLSGYALRHGEAVAIGIALDVTYCHLSGMLSEKDWHACLQLLQDLGFALFHEALLTTDGEGRLSVLLGLEEFREHLGGQLTIMLLEAIGKGKEVHAIDQKVVVQALSTLQRHATARSGQH